MCGKLDNNGLQEVVLEKQGRKMKQYHLSQEILDLFPYAN